MNRWPRIALVAGWLALLGLWLLTARAERRLEDETNAYLARSVGRYLRLTTPSDGAGGLNATRLLSGVGALRISSFWPGGLEGALGSRPLLTDSLELVPLPAAVATRLDQGVTVVRTSHARRPAAIAPLFDRDEWDVIGWVAVWRSLGGPWPGPVAVGLAVMAAAAMIGAGRSFLRDRPLLWRRRVAWAAALVGLLAGLGFARDLRSTARRATEVRLRTSARLIEVAATANGVRRSRLPEIAVDAVVSPAARDSLAPAEVNYVRDGGVGWARIVAATPRQGDDTALEIRLLPSGSGLGFTWAAMVALTMLAIGSVGLAAWTARQSPRTHAFRTTMAAWGFLAPALVHLLLFSVLPVLFTFYLAFHRWDLLGGARPFVGLANFGAIFRDSRFGHSLLITVLYSLHVPVTMAVALGAALALDRGGIRVRALRTILFMPAVSSVVAAALVWQWLYQPESGWLNALLRAVGVQGPDWLGSRWTALPALMAIAVWAQLGYQMVVFLGGLQAIPGAYHDAARVDGASAWSRFRWIVLPLLRPTILFVLVTSLIGSFQVFTYVAVMTDGGPLAATDVAVFRIYQEGWEFLRFGTASAMSLVLLAALLAITWACFRWLGRQVELV
jgi:multiple sugar transport system permease protein